MVLYFEGAMHGVFAVLFTRGRRKSWYNWREATAIRWKNVNTNSVVFYG